MRSGGDPHEPTIAAVVVGRTHSDVARGLRTRAAAERQPRVRRREIASDGRFALLYVRADGAWRLSLAQYRPEVHAAPGVRPPARGGGLAGEHIDWRLVRWFLAGAVPGGVVGAWIFTRASAAWLQLLIALFLVSAPLQYRLGVRERSFRVRPWHFTVAGLLVAFLSGLIGGTGPVLNPLYLNYGAVKEEMVGTKSFNSLVMHATKLSTYTTLGAVRRGFLWYGLSVGVVAILANWLGKRFLERLSIGQFRQLVIWLMVASGVFMLWKQRETLVALWRSL